MTDPGDRPEDRPVGRPEPEREPWQPGYVPGPTPYGQPPPGYGYPPPGYGPYGRPPRKPGTNGFAIAGFIFAFLFWPLGVAFSLIALSQIKQTGQGGRGLAIAGVVISIIGLVVGVLTLLSGAYTTGP